MDKLDGRFHGDTGPLPDGEMFEISRHQNRPRRLRRFQERGVMFIRQPDNACCRDEALTVATKVFENMHDTLTGELRRKTGAAQDGGIF